MERSICFNAIRPKGRNKASYIQRAHILLKSADGKTDAEISQWLYISESTVRRTRLRFCDAGIDVALEDEAPTEREPLLNEQQEGRLLALTCSAPPDGRERWTLELLTERLIADGVVDSISVESVRLLLQKKHLKPWQVRQWCIPKVTPQFIERMEAILTLYAQPEDPQRPMICFDEKMPQLLADARRCPSRRTLADDRIMNTSVQAHAICSCWSNRKLENER